MGRPHKYGGLDGVVSNLYVLAMPYQSRIPVRCAPLLLIVLFLVCARGQTCTGGIGYWNVSTLAGSGTAGYADGQGSTALFNGPVAVSLDSFSNLYVGDMNNHMVRRITPDGVVTTLAGSGSAGFSDGTGTEAAFRQPHVARFFGSAV